LLQEAVPDNFLWPAVQEHIVAKD